MDKTLPSGSMFIDRRDLMHMMMSLWISQSRFSRHMKSDSFTAGYHEGYLDGLLALAAGAGVFEEFATLIKNTKRRIG